MSTKVSIAETTEWELFQRMWDTDKIRLRADMQVYDGAGGDDDDGAPLRDVTIVIPKKWIREMSRELDKAENQ